MTRISRKVLPFRSRRDTSIQLPLLAGLVGKAAQISGFPQFRNVESFGQLRWKELQAFAPSTLVGYRLDLTRMAAQLQVEGAKLQSLNHAIFVLTDCGSHMLSDEHRSSLWHSFGVPVFELIIAPGCRMLASECEAHDGWHITEGFVVYELNGELIYEVPPTGRAHTGFSGEIESTPCQCGRSSSRLKNLSPYLPQPYERSLIASA